MCGPRRSVPNAVVTEGDDRNRSAVAVYKATTILPIFFGPEMCICRNDSQSDTTTR